MNNKESIDLIFRQLSRDSQRHLIAIIHMAQIAENGKLEEISNQSLGTAQVS